MDRLDELKTNIDERKVVANAGAYALGRKTDELIIAALDSATREAVGTASGQTDNDGLTRAKVLLAFEMLGAAEVPDDGQRFAVVGWKQWSELLLIQEFANAQYVGEDELPWKGTQAKRWLGALWMPHGGLTKNGALRYCYFYHRTAVGHASAAEISTDITWHGDRAAHFVNTMMSQGAVLVDDTGVVPCAASRARNSSDGLQSPTTLSVLAYANGFTLWHYTTTDSAATTDTSGYFNTRRRHAARRRHDPRQRRHDRERRAPASSW